MGSKADRPINYDFKNPLKTFNLAFDLFFADHLTDSREEDKEEYRNKPKKRRDDD